MSIRWKLLASFLVLFVAFVFIQGFNIYISETQWREIKKIEEETLKAALLAEEMKLSVVQVQQWLTDISATQGKDGLDDGFEEAERYAQQFYEQLEEMKRLFPQETAMLEETKKAFDDYYEMGKKMANEYITGGVASGNAIMGQFDQVAEEINEHIEAIRTSRVTEINESVHNIGQSTQANYQLSIVFFALSLVVGLAMWYFISRSMIRPLNQLIQTTKRIAGGDLSEPIPVGSTDEIGELSRSFESMRRNLSTLIKQIQTISHKMTNTSQELTVGANTMQTAGQQIASAMEQIASGAETQATGADESSKAMDEMAIGIQRIAEVSGKVADLSAETAKEAMKGNESIQQVIAKMETIGSVVQQTANVVAELDRSSEEINQIIEAITTITNQTNLLALNASIEAARAGEHGKGFAVVANEVKKLAEESKRSAEMIEAIIQNIKAETAKAVLSIEEGTREAEEGRGLAHEAGNVFQLIWKDAEQVAEQIQEVSAATEQMSAGFEQVTASIGELNVIANANYAQSREASSFSQSQLTTIRSINDYAHLLNQMAKELNESVNHFTIETSQQQR